MAEPRFDVTTLGEMLIRLSVPSGERLQSARGLEMHPAGAEANVATLLARLGRRSHWTGALPKNPRYSIWRRFRWPFQPFEKKRCSRM